MATWLAADQLDFHGAAAVASGWLAARPSAARPARARARPRLARVPRGLRRPRGRRQRDGARARRAVAAELGRRFGVARPRDARPRARGRGARGVARRSRRACAASTRPPRPRSRARRRSRSRAPGRAASSSPPAPPCCDYERAAEWCDRIAEFAERYGSRYMLGFCRAEYGAVHLWRGRWAEAEALLEGSVEDFARSRPRLRRRRRSSGWRSCGGGRGGSTRPRRCSSGPAPRRRRSSAAHDSPSTPASRGSRVELAERLRRQTHGRPRPDAGRRCSSVLVRARLGARRRSTAPPSAATELRELERLIGTAPLRAAADLAEGIARGRRRRPRARPHAARGRRRRVRALRGPVRGGAGAARARRDAWPALGRAEARCERARRRAGRRWPSSARRRRPQARSDPVTPREREVLALLADGLTNRQIAERLVVSEHTVHRHVANILRKLDVPPAARPPRTPCVQACWTRRRVADPAIRRRPRMAGSGEAGVAGRTTVAT